MGVSYITMAYVHRTCVFTVESCEGEAMGDYDQGTTLTEILSHLSQRYCGCVHVLGNVQVVLTGLDGTLTDNDFKFFYHLKTISGVLWLKGFPAMELLTLPNLVLIRSTAGQNLSLIVEDSHIGSLNLPSMHEITSGSVLFSDVNGMCNFLAVNWN